MTKIVIADDHQFLRSGLEAVLISMGFEIAASVGDGDAALLAIASEDPEVAILDVRMPQLGGVEVLEAMRAKGDMRPVILLTAEMEDASLLAAIKAKVNGIVFKDAAATELKKAIATVLAGDRAIAPDLMDRAFSLSFAKAQGPSLDDLSDRERQIVEAVAEGKRNREIAEEVGMTEGSIKVYLHRIFEKLRVESRTELTVMVLAEKRK